MTRLIEGVSTFLGNRFFIQIETGYESNVKRPKYGLHCQRIFCHCRNFSKIASVSPTPRTRAATEFSKELLAHELYTSAKYGSFSGENAEKTGHSWRKIIP